MTNSKTKHDTDEIARQVHHPKRHVHAEYIIQATFKDGAVRYLKYYGTKPDFRRCWWNADRLTFIAAAQNLANARTIFRGEGWTFKLRKVRVDVELLAEEEENKENDSDEKERVVDEKSIDPLAPRD